MSKQDNPSQLPPRRSSLVDDIIDPTFPSLKSNTAQNTQQFRLAHDLVFAYVSLVWLLSEQEERALASSFGGTESDYIPRSVEEEDSELERSEKSSVDDVSTWSLFSDADPNRSVNKEAKADSKSFWKKVTDVFGANEAEGDSFKHPAVVSYRTWRYQLLHGLAASNQIPDEELKVIQDLSNHNGITIDSLSESLCKALLAASSTLPSSDTQSASPKDETVILILSNLIFSSLQQTIAQSGELKYDARLRTILRRLALLIWDGVYTNTDNGDDAIKARALMVQQVEHNVAEMLWKEAHTGRHQGEADGDVERVEDKSEKWKRWAGVGLATVGGGVVIGLTGGLAAPLIGAGLGSVFSGLGLAGAAHVGFCAMLGTTAGAAIVGTLFGVTGGGLTAYRFNRRLGSLTSFSFHSLTPIPDTQAENPTSQSLHQIIPISGWLTTMSDITDPWTILPAYAPFSDVTALSFDPHHLLELGKAFQSFMKSSAVTYGTTTVLKQTMLAGLVSALVWPVGLLQLGYLVDNPWSIGLDRAKKAGIVLAKDVLGRYVQGKRPVTLIGWSLGARAIFYCLLELAKMRAYGIIDEAYLLGAPVGTHEMEWRAAASVVSGRMVNGYSTEDWFLGYLYRASEVKGSVAGLRRVRVLSERLENVDLSDLVKGHLKYRDMLPEILEKVGFERGLCGERGRTEVIWQEGMEMPGVSSDVGSLGTVAL